MPLFSKEFKKAISQLPSTEKDKLILRLLKKDLNLANRLMFELVDTSSVVERRELIEQHIINSIEQISKRFYSIGYLNMDVRYLSGDITEHVEITKDKYGEVSLNLLLLNEVLRQNKTHILNARPPAKLRKFSIAIISRVFKVLLLINKMDEDLLLDFEESLTLLGKEISSNDNLMNISIKNGLDLNWLLSAEVPSDIIRIHKELRSNGFLK